jgi:hypothetical protein
MTIGLLSLRLEIPGCMSLKEKRSRLKPLLIRLHREFNVSIAEIGCLDTWQEAFVGCVMVSNNTAFTQRALEQVVGWVENSWPDLQIIDHQIEIMNFREKKWN